MAQTAPVCTRPLLNSPALAPFVRPRSALSDADSQRVKDPPGARQLAPKLIEIGAVFRSAAVGLQQVLILPLQYD